MADIRVPLELPTGRVQTVELPDDVSIGELVPEIITTLGLPSTGPDGTPTRYELHSKRLGRNLRADETLAAAGIGPEETIRMVPDVTAGGGCRG